MLKTASTSISSRLCDAYEYRYTKKLLREIHSFYRSRPFIPSPRTIDLLDVRCMQKVADDIALFGKDAQYLHNKVINLLDII
jgi:hypothetical protein